MQPMGGNTDQFGDQAFRPVEVQRIDQHAGIGLSDLRDNAAGGAHIGDRGPGHEFEIGGQSVLRRALAEFCEAIGKAVQIRIIAGDQDILGAEPRAGLEERRRRPRFRSRA